MRIKLKHSVLMVALLGQGVVFAQQKKIDTVEFNVVSKYKPVITEAEKLNNNPNVADTAKIPRKAEYNNLINSQFPTVYTPAAIDAIRMKGEPLDKLEHSYFDAGFGNYNTVYGEYFFNCLRSRDYDYGIHLNHISSDGTLNGVNSSYAFNNVNLYGEAFLHNHTLYAQADYNNQIVHEYGWDSSRAKLTDNDGITRENYNYFGGALDFKSTYKDSSKIGHDIKVAYDNFSDAYSATENNMNVDLHAFTYYQKQRIDIKAAVQYYQDNNASQDTAKTLNLAFNPYFTTIEKHWDAHLGVKVDYDATNKFTAYPDLLARYHVANDLIMFYAGVDGDKTFNSYKSLVDMNPYIKDTVNMQYSFTQIHIFGGMTGTISSDITYNLSGYQSEIKQMPLFVTDTNEFLQNRFSVVYDKVKIINGHGDISYRMKENLKLTLGADYFMYTPTEQLKAWYHPNIMVNLLGQYTLQSKYIIKAQFYLLGPQYAPQMSEGIVTAKQIGAYPDLNLGLDYHYSHLLTVFINLNNLANISYQRWLNYPTEEFNILAGARLTF